MFRAAAAVIAAALAVPAVVVAAPAVDEDRASTLALSYRNGKSATVDLMGLRPLSGHVAQAEVKRQEGRTRIKLDVTQPLPHPLTLGSFYTAYVLWAIAPEGRSEKLAELRHGEPFDVDVTTSLPSFALVVTAEPHPGVLRPGPRIVAENAPRMDDDDAVQAGRVEYEPASEYTLTSLGEAGFTTPLLLLGARRAVELARAAGAPEFAEPELRQAEIKLAVLEQLQAGKRKLSRESEAVARDVMRLSEEARYAAADRREEARTAAERRAARQRIADAEQEAERSRQEAERLRLEREQEEERARQAREEAEAYADAQRRAQEQAAAAQAQAQQAEAAAEQARQAAEQALHDKAELQERLYRSLSAVLETRREARGLIVNLSDVLFDTGRATLKPGAREKLSRLAGILLAYPGDFHVEVEGHTDSVGSEEYNLRLSQSRAESVRTYLQQAGIDTTRFTRITGFGESRPVASNVNAAGRQMNRRVELVITDLEGDRAAAAR
jgi:outer membrane protein OmpA-like peptidoglycan-associated protein